MAAVAIMDGACPLLGVDAEEGVLVGLNLRAVALEVDRVGFHRAPQPPDEDVAQIPAGSSIEILMPRARSNPGNSAAVNGQPWSVPKIFCVPSRAIARCTARTQNPASRGLDISRQDRPAVPVEHRTEEDEATVDRHSRAVRRPNLVGGAITKRRSNYSKIGWPAALRERLGCRSMVSSPIRA